MFLNSDGKENLGMKMMISYICLRFKAVCGIVTIVLLIPTIVEKSTGFLTLHSKQDFSNQAYNIHTYILYSIYTHITYTHLPNNPSLYFYWLSKSRPEYIPKYKHE